jgi:hypothetical protein
MTTNTQALLDQMERELHEPRRDAVPGGPLFHYTDGAGLLGIIRERQIWATHYAHVKDTEELVAGERIVDDVAARLLRETLADSPAEWLLGNFVRLHQSKAQNLSPIADVYVASFSAQGNDLSEWRGYAADGAGYSIGLGAFHLPKGDESAADFSLMLAKCEYDRERFEEAVAQVLTAVVTGFEKYVRVYSVGPEMFNALMTHAASLALRRVALLVPAFKDAAFAHEEEWRLVAMPRRGREAKVVRFRSARNGIVPYIPIALSDADKPLALTRIYIGPRQHPDAGRKAVSSFLAANGYDDEGLAVSSGISYRG